MQRATFAVSLGLLAAVLAGCGDGDQTMPADAGQAGAAASAAAPKSVRPWHVIKTYAVPEASVGHSQTRLSYDEAGNALASWPTAGKDAFSNQADLELLPISADGKVGQPNRHDGYVFAGPVGAPAGDGEFVDAGNNDDPGQFSGLSVHRAGVDGEIEDVQQILPADSHAVTAASNAVTFAVAEGGASVVAWTEFDPDAGADGEERLRAAVRPRAGARYGEPVTLRQGPGGLGGVGGLAAAVDQGGRVAVAYAGDASTQARGARVWTGSSTAGFDAPIELGESGNSNEIRTVITTNGRTVVAWGEYAHGEEPASPWIVRSASVVAGKSKASRVETIGNSKDVGVPATNIALAAGPGGTALLAWTQYRGKLDTGNRIAEASATGRFGIERDLPGHVIGGLAIREDGAAVVTVSDGGDADPSHWYALGRPPGGIIFGATEPLASENLSAAKGLTAPSPFYSPKTGQASVAWTEPAAGGRAARLVIQTRERQ